VTVPARITVVTVGVRDFETQRDFYRGLGWTTAVELDDFAVFELRGAVLALFPLDQLAEDGRSEPAAADRGIAVSLAINVDERDEVDSTIEAARSAGARITKEPVDAEWGGRTAYFADPEDNYWEVAWVPPDSLVAGAIRHALGES
jgi:catechol 2,3-dioxygenase-like lactoylglutathione lyase family enzyme